MNIVCFTDSNSYGYVHQGYFDGCYEAVQPIG